MFPGFVSQHTVAFDECDPREAEDVFSGVVFPASLASAVRKRRLEFAAGRHCARQALGRFSQRDAARSIPSGSAREPLWPAGIVGAITHTHGFASAAVARSRDARGVGLDAERWIPDETAERLCGAIAGEAELARIARATGWSVARALTLAFSAKESVFKCYYPEVRRYFDFRDVAVISVDPLRSELAGEVLVRLTPLLVPGYPFRCRFEHDDQLVCTASIASPA